MTQRTPEEEAAHVEGLARGKEEIERILREPGAGAKIRRRYTPATATAMFARVKWRTMTTDPSPHSEAELAAFCDGFLEAVRTRLDRLFE